MHGSLAKYKLGFGMVALFGIILVVIVVVQASATKSDNNTYQQASGIADKLNTYTESNNVIPDSLATAGVGDTPSSVNYHKLSNTSYQFCVTYKTTSSGFDASNVETQLLTAEATAVGSSSSTPADNTYLYLDSTHHKGQNCQTISPVIYNPLQNNISSGTDFSSPVTTN